MNFLHVWFITWLMSTNFSETTPKNNSTSLANSMGRSSTRNWSKGSPSRSVLRSSSNVWMDKVVGRQVNCSTLGWLPLGNSKLISGSFQVMQDDFSWFQDSFEIIMELWPKSRKLWISRKFHWIPKHWEFLLYRRNDNNWMKFVQQYPLIWILFQIFMGNKVSHNSKGLPTQINNQLLNKIFHPIPEFNLLLVKAKRNGKNLKKMICLHWTFQKKIKILFDFHSTIWVRKMWKNLLQSWFLCSQKIKIWFIGFQHFWFTIMWLEWINNFIQCMSNS